MANEQNSRHHTADEMKAKASAVDNLTDWARVHAESEAELDADIGADPDSQLDPDCERTAVLVIPAGQEELFLEARTLRWFRSKGDGWQSRINDILRAAMQEDGKWDAA